MARGVQIPRQPKNNPLHSGVGVEVFEVVTCAEAFEVHPSRQSVRMEDAAKIDKGIVPLDLEVFLGVYCTSIVRPLISARLLPRCWTWFRWCMRPCFPQQGKSGASLLDRFGFQPESVSEGKTSQENVDWEYEVCPIRSCSRVQRDLSRGTLCYSKFVSSCTFQKGSRSMGHF